MALWQNKNLHHQTCRGNNRSSYPLNQPLNLPLRQLDTDHQNVPLPLHNPQQSLFRQATHPQNLHGISPVLQMREISHPSHLPSGLLLHNPCLPPPQKHQCHKHVIYLKKVFPLDKGQMMKRRKETGKVSLTVLALNLQVPIIFVFLHFLLANSLSAFKHVANKT